MSGCKNKPNLKLKNKTKTVLIRKYECHMPFSILSDAAPSIQAHVSAMIRPSGLSELVIYMLMYKPLSEQPGSFYCLKSALRMF